MCSGRLFVFHVHVLTYWFSGCLICSGQLLYTVGFLLTVFQSYLVNCFSQLGFLLCSSHIWLTAFHSWVFIDCVPAMFGLAVNCLISVVCPDGPV